MHVLSRGLGPRSVGPPQASRPHSCYGEAPPPAWQGGVPALSLGVTWSPAAVQEGEVDVGE